MILHNAIGIALRLVFAVGIAAVLATTPAHTHDHDTDHAPEAECTVCVIAPDLDDTPILPTSLKLVVDGAAEMKVGQTTLRPLLVPVLKRARDPPRH